MEIFPDDDMLEEYFLSVFPGLEEYWERDYGETFEDTFKRLWDQKWRLRLKRERIKWDMNCKPSIDALDIDYQRIRLVPAEEECGKSYYTQEEEAILDALEHDSLSGPIKLGTETYFAIMDLIDRRKVRDEKNAAIMESILQAMFGYQDQKEKEKEEKGI